MEHYFAYGSNLDVARMRGRVPSARPLLRARLPGRRLVFDKAGSDGSGKANLAVSREGQVWGVVYAIEIAEWPLLDAYEPGYARISVLVLGDSGERLSALTYEALERTPDPRPRAWYHRLVLEGARAHGLPADYLEELSRAPLLP